MANRFEELGGMLVEPREPSEIEKLGAQPVTTSREMRQERERQMQQQLDQMKSQLGSSAQMPKGESPLNFMERADFGWARSDQERLRFLEQKFGKDNVTISRSEADRSGFVVNVGDKKTPDWRVVDPSGISDIGGDIAQFLGERGVQAAGAAIGGLKGGIAGAAVGGPIGAAVGTIAGGAAGAGGGELIEQGYRKVLEQVAPEATGAQAAPQSIEDSIRQVGAAMLFGAEQEVGGQVLRGVGRVTGKTLSGIIKRIGDTPERKSAVTSYLQLMTGQPRALARARVDNPEKVARFDKLALNDVRLNRDSLRKAQQGLVRKLEGKLSKRVRQNSSEYTAIDQRAVGARFNPKQEVDTLFQQLEDNGFISQAADGSKQILGGLSKAQLNAANVVTPDIAGSNLRALRSTMKTAEIMKKRLDAGQQVSLKDMKLAVDNLDNFLFRKEGAVSNKNLNRLLKGYRASLKNSINKQLDEFEPGLGTLRSKLDKDNNEVKNLLDILGGKSSEEKADTFVKQLVRADGSFNSELGTLIAKRAGIDNPTRTILEMESARTATDLFRGFQFTGRGFVPRLPRAGAATVTLGSGAAQASRQALAPALPFLNQIVRTARSFAPADRARIFSDPQTIKIISDLVSGTQANQNQLTQDLLDEAGITNR